jgi:riboflavin synthase
MFTGIITDIGKIIYIKRGDIDTKIRVLTKFNIDEIDIGASVACSGVCLTVVKKLENWLEFDISNETINSSKFSQLEQGYELNLERSMQIGSEIGGHIVSGHVDCLAQLVKIEKDLDSHILDFKLPDNYKKFIAAKGSVTLDGISLTVNYVDDNIFSVNIIKHTWDNTIFKNLKLNDFVNLEVDMLARYISRQLEVLNG